MAMEMTVMKEFRHEASGHSLVLAQVFDGDEPIAYRVIRVSGLRLPTAHPDYSKNHLELSLPVRAPQDSYLKAAKHFAEQVQPYL